MTKFIFVFLLMAALTAPASGEKIIGFIGTCDSGTHGSPVLELSVRDGYQYANLSVRREGFIFVDKVFAPKVRMIGGNIEQALLMGGKYQIVIAPSTSPYGKYLATVYDMNEDYSFEAPCRDFDFVKK